MDEFQEKLLVLLERLCEATEAQHRFAVEVDERQVRLLTAQQEMMAKAVATQQASANAIEEARNARRAAEHGVPVNWKPS